MIVVLKKMEILINVTISLINTPLKDIPWGKLYDFRVGGNTILVTHRGIGL